MVDMRPIRCLLLICALIAALPGALRAQNEQSDDLYHAVRIGDTETVSELLAAGVDPSIPNSAGRFAIFAAADRGRLEILRKLLDAGANLGQVDNLNRTVLYPAVSRNRPAIVTLLAERGADLNWQDAGGETVLMVAVRARNEAMAALIFSLGPDLSIRNAQGETALDIALAAGEAGLVELVRSADPSGPVRITRAEIEDSLLEGRFHLLSRQLSGDLAFEVTNEEGYSLLVTAIRRGAYQAARQLVASGARLNSAEPDRRDRSSPLIAAIRAGETELAHELVEAGADIEYRYPREGAYTPLMIAAKNRNREMARLLIAAGADVNALTDLGVSAYHIAVNRGNLDIAETLREAGATRPAYWYDRGGARNRSGIYTLEVLIDFDVLRGIKFDPERRVLSLFGENFQPGRLHRIPYIDYLATAYRINIDGFSLEPVDEYEAEDEVSYSAFSPSPGFFSDYSAYTNSELGLPAGGLVPARERYFLHYGIPSGDGHWLGMHYRDVWEGIRIWRIAPNAPASDSGLQEGDLIIGLDDLEILSVEALEAYVNARDVGTTIGVRVLRGGRDLSFDVAVEALKSTAGMIRGELLAFVFRGLNQPRKAVLVEWLDCGIGTTAPDSADQGLEAIARCTSRAIHSLGLDEAGPYQNLQTLLELAGQELFISSRRLEVADVSDHEALWSILNRARMSLHRVHVSKFLDVPDEGRYLLDNPYRFRDHLRMRKLEYYPETYRSSLLGRSMFEADARLKKTLGLPMDRYELTGFPIDDFRDGFTAYGGRRWWIYADHISYLENPNLGEVRIDRADIVIGAEDYRSASDANNNSGESSFRSAYSEYHRRAIAENIDDFKRLYPEIHDGFEAVKIVYLGRRLRNQYDLGAYLPSAGQGTWQAPELWVTRDLGGVSLTGGTETARQTRSRLTPEAPAEAVPPPLSVLRSPPRDIRQRLMSEIRAPAPLDPAGARNVSNAGDRFQAPRSSESVQRMIEAVDYARSEALNKGIGMVRDAADKAVAVFVRAPKSSLDTARTIMSVGEGAADDVGWVLEDVSDDERTLGRSSAAPWRTVDRLLPDSWVPDCLKDEDGCS